MGTRKGRRIATITSLAVILLGGTLVWLGRDHIRFFLSFESLGPNAQGYADYRHRQTGIVFVCLPGGRFLMGSPESDEGRFGNEGPLHSVTVSRFLISKSEVTQAQWAVVMGDDRSSFDEKRLPMVRISWDDCGEFCANAGLKLPTEAQWEYACRAGATTRFSFGDDFAMEQANCGYRSDRAVAVESFRPNRFGIHHMHGNVWEWCEDVFDKSFYSKPEAATRNPVCRSRSENRVLRGGAWGTDPRLCRSAYREQRPRSYRDHKVGFRPAALLP